MIKRQRPSLFYNVNSRPVQFFKGEKIYVSTGDSDDMENGEIVSYYNRPSRANVQPRVNDIIFAKMQNTDKTFQIDEQMSNMIFSTGFFDISSKIIYPRFLYYLIKSDEYSSYRNAYSEGTTQISITDSRLKKIYITYETDYKEQIKIADYLDKKTNTIDKMIEKINKQIDKYQLYKQTLITNTIKFGLDNCEKKKVEDKYINSIAKNYKIIKTKYVCSLITDGSHESPEEENGEYPFLSTVNIENGSFNFDTALMTSKSSYMRLFLQKCNPQDGDVLISKDGTIGKTVLIDYSKDFIVASSLVIMRPLKNVILPKYLRYNLDSQFTQICLNQLMSGSALQRVSVWKNSNINIVLSPLDEQKRIILYLDKKVEKINKIINIKKQKIDELNRYKKSIVYEYVSGKKAL